MKIDQPLNNVGAHLLSGGLAQFIPEPAGAAGGLFRTVVSGVGSALNAGLGGLSPEYSDLINKQIEVQRQLQLTSLYSNLEKSKHETEMAAVRNIRAG